jgi:hypothetical protein
MIIPSGGFETLHSVTRFLNQFWKIENFPKLVQKKATFELYFLLYAAPNDLNSFLD